MPTLVIHLGLAKTGTTTLQKRFFPQVHGYLGKSYPDGLDLLPPGNGRAVTDSLVELWNNGHDSKSVSDWVSRLNFEEFPTILISNESFSRWRDDAKSRSSSWPVQKPHWGEAPRRGSHPIIGFLASLKTALPPTVDLLTILTVRSQKTYLLSHASQARAQSMGPIVRRIGLRRDAFILWDRLVDDLSRLRGSSSHLTLLFEDGVEHNAREMVRFCRMQPRIGEFQYDEMGVENRRRRGANSWQRRDQIPRLANLATTLSASTLWLPHSWRTLLGGFYLKGRRVLKPLKLTLTSKQLLKIERYTQASNDALAAALNRDLGPLGY